LRKSDVLFQNYFGRTYKINIKKQQFIYDVNGNGSKTAKITKGDIIPIP